MQILLHADPHTDGRQKMAEHLEVIVNDALGHFRERITRVEAHLSEEAKVIHCTLEARLVGLEPLIVKDHAANAHQAIEGALRKLKRAVGEIIAKHDSHHPRTAALPDTEVTGDLPV